MSGFKRINTNTKGVLLWTLKLDDEVIDKEYLLLKLKSREITEVESVKKSDGSCERIVVADWLNKEYGGTHRNYCWLLFYLTIFCAFRWPDREAEDFEEFVNIPKDTWDDLIPNSKGQRIIISNILEASEVIEVNHKYLSAAAAANSGAVPFSKSYRIFNGSNRKITSASIPEIDTTKVFNNERWLNNNTNTAINGDGDTTEAIKSHYKMLRISDEAIDIAERFDYSYADNPTRAKAIVLSNVSKIHSFAALTKKPSQREYWNYSFKYHAHVGRCYHNLTQFKKAFRYMLTVKGAPLWQVDAGAAHPFLLIKLYDRAEAHATNLERERKKYSTRFSHNSDFYSTVGEFGKIARESAKQTDEDYRLMVKGMFWEFIFGKPNRPDECEFTQAYQRLFPILLRTINTMKTSWVVGKKSIEFKKIEEKWKRRNAKLKREERPEIPLTDMQYVQLSYLMQQLEGDIMIKGVCRHLVHEGLVVDGKLRKPWFIPLHDAIWCQRYAAKPLTKLMKEYWHKETGAIPAFKRTSLG